MTRENDRFARNQDGDTTTHTGDDMPDDHFRAFATWVNNPVSAWSKHDVPEGLRTAIDAVDDPAERKRLQAAVEAYEDATLSPRDFVYIVTDSDAVDYFDPLSTPEGWDTNAEDREAPPRPDVDWSTDEPEDVPKGPTVDADFAKAVVTGLLIVALIVVVVFVL